MTADLNHIVDVVEQIMTDELPSGVAQVEGRTVWWRNLDDPEYDSQPRQNYPLIELEFVGASNRRGEYGAPGCNRWEENAAFMVHVHVDRGNDSLQLARDVMSAVINALCGRQIDNVQIRDAMAEFSDPAGEGLTRGVSRAIEYQYEYTGR